MTELDTAVLQDVIPMQILLCVRKKSEKLVPKSQVWLLCKPKLVLALSDESTAFHPRSFSEFPTRNPDTRVQAAWPYVSINLRF